MPGQPESACGQRLMPWTARQVRYLLSKRSPLKKAQKSKMESELDQNPKLGHRKGGKPLKRTHS
jgi:hypothetical protein